MKKQEEGIVEVRSTVNDNVVMSFSYTEEESMNVITAGFAKICDMLHINRVQAESRFYVTKA